MARLKDHVERGLVDKELVEWLSEVNRYDCIVTTSSCSGRLTLHTGGNPLDKKSSKILASWHDPSRAVREACYTTHMEYKGLVWLALQPPIVHIITPYIDVAALLVDSAVRSGMRRSCVRPSVHGWQVEVRAGDKSLYYFSGEPDCNVVEELGSVLSVYKGRFFGWMNKVLDLLSTEEVCGSH